jgi:lipoate-protein ligase A
MPTWRYLVTPPATGAENMALDEALMEAARSTGEWLLRVYSWVRPTISFGRNQTAQNQYDLDRIRELGLDIVRRPTGGRAILHHREVTYSVSAPLGGAGDLRDSYTRINRLLLHALHSLGARAEVAGDAGRATRPGIAPCFDEPAAGELMLGGRKLAGSAQWRADGALLQHGSILVGDDQSLLASLTLGADHDIPPPATLNEALGRAPSVSEVARALRDAVRVIESADPVELLFALDGELSARSSAHVVRYVDDHWTWRR